MLESPRMHPFIPQLLELQRLDQLISTLRADLEGLPKRFRDADAKLNGARAAVVAAKEAHTHAQTERKRFELDVEQWKDRARKYRGQSSSVKTNEAYKALQHEIANAEAEAAKAEDLVLGQMMAVEETERRIKHVEADLKESDQAISAEKKKIEREKLAATIPGNILELYTRVAKRHPGSAMAQVRDDQCRACGMRVLPHTIQLLKLETDEEVFRCETCGRILYSLEPIPHASSAEAAEGAGNS
jgi:predicted  nucleic acid-binding Zn-ribbon protein